MRTVDPINARLAILTFVISAGIVALVYALFGGK